MTRIVRTVVVILGCAFAAGPLRADVFVRDDIVTDPTPRNFSVCHGGSCTLVSQVSLDDGQWSRIASVFAPPAGDAQEERARIAEAIARFETIVGPITGTDDDRAENQRGDNWRGQMDCIDESTNTTTYLRILVKTGLLRWYRVEDRVTRGFFLFGWPHTTAVVSDQTTGRKWAVDSWFFANGVPPVIVPLEQWRQVRWRPDKPTETATKP